MKHWILRGAKIFASVAALILLLALAPNAARAGPDANRWAALGNGVNKYVNSLALRGSDLYVGGGFTKAGGSAASRMAEWNITSKAWTNCGNGVKSDVLVMMPYGKKIFVGGSFGGGLKTWHTTKEKWGNVSGGVQGIVSALAFDKNEIYVGGKFDMVGGNVTAHNIAKYNVTTKTWSPLGNGLDGQVWTIAPIASGTVFVGGEFQNEYGAGALNYIAAWNGANWNALGTGTNEPVYTIAPYANVLFVGGSFTQAGGVNSHYMAAWILGQNAHWEKTYGFSGGSPLYGTLVWKILIVGDNMYVGGSFSEVEGVIPAANIVQENLVTRTWSALGAGVNDTVWALAYNASDKGLYVGGEFTKAGGKNVAHVAKWKAQ